MNNKHLGIFGTLLHDPNLWHMNRKSVSWAFANGLFFAWWPVPFQMILAAAVSILFRTNLPLSVALVWITNPVTMPVMFYFAYLVGTWILGVPETSFEFELTIAWLVNELSAIWKPFLTGCFIMGVFSSVAGYIGIQLVWIASIRSKHARRKLR